MYFESWFESNFLKCLQSQKQEWIEIDHKNEKPKTEFKMNSKWIPNMNWNLKIEKNYNEMENGK